MDVIPCQYELNLPSGGEVTLGLHLEVRESLPSLASPSLVSWYVKAEVEGQDAVKLLPPGARGMPFQERGHPDLVLNEWNSVTTGRVTENKGQEFFSFRNTYDSEHGILEYGVALLDADGDSRSGDTISPSASGENLLGLLSVEGNSSGNAQFTADVTGLAGSRIAVLDEHSDVRIMDLATRTPLAVVNVGPYAEKARFEGQVWSDIPSPSGELVPFWKPFQIEIWSPGAAPTWKGGLDQPLVTYFSLEADKSGSFSVSDISPLLIQPGSYDLRLKGESTLSVADYGVEIDTSGGLLSSLPAIVRADFGPLPSGDLNGDNTIGEEDLSALKSEFGMRTKSVEGGTAADLNRDGVIDGQDFSLLAVNLGKSGG